MSVGNLLNSAASGIGSLFNPSAGTVDSGSAVPSSGAGVGTLQDLGGASYPSSAAMPSTSPDTLVSPSTTTGSSAGSSGASPMMGGDIGSLIKNLSGGIALGSGINTLIKGPGTVPYKGQQLTNANAQSTEGNQLINAMSTGVLPPGEEQQIDQQLQASVAQIKAKYANMGLSGSTMEQQEIQAAQNTAVTTRAQMAQQATTEGMNLLNNSSTTLTNLANQNLQLDKEYQDALAALASAGLGGTKGS